MKIIYSIYFFLSLFFTIACSNKPVAFNTDYAFGIMETSNKIFSKTQIRLYDDKGNTLETITVPLGGIYQAFVPLSIGFHRFLYAPVQGTFTRAESSLFRFDMLNGLFKTYEYPTGVRKILADDENPDLVFFIDFDFHLVKWDYKNGKELAKLDLSKYLFEHLQVHKDKIYFFGHFQYKKSIGETVDLSHLLILNKHTLETEKILHISKQGMGHFSSYVHDNFLFFTNNYGSAYILSALNLNTHEISDYSLLAPFPYLIAPYKNTLIISHNDVLEPKNNQISVFNLDDHSMKLYSLSTLDEAMFQMEVQGDVLYTRGGYYLQKYDILKDFQRVESYFVKTPIGHKKYPTFGNSSHLSVFFLNPKNNF